MSYLQNTRAATMTNEAALAPNSGLPHPQRQDCSARLSERGRPRPMNVATELLTGALRRGWGERLALRWFSGKRGIACTYGQLAVQVNRIVRVLQDKLGLVPGDRVLLLGSNHPMLGAALLAVLKAGLVAVTTPPLLRACELKAIVEAAKVNAALCDARLRKELDRLAAPSSEFYVPTLAHALLFNSNALDALEARAAHVPIAMVVEVSDWATFSDDLALITFSPGAGGRLMGTMHFHRELWAMPGAIPQHALSPSSDDIFCGTPSLASPVGLSAFLTLPLLAGASALLVEPLNPAGLLTAARETQATVMAATPTMYQHMALLLKSGKAAPVPSLRRCVSIGAMRSDATRALWRESTGVELIAA